MSNRIYVVSAETDDDEPWRISWFDSSKAVCYRAEHEWDERAGDLVDKITRSPWIDEYLFRTRGGRWVLNHDAHRYFSGSDTYRFVTDEQARDWLLRSGLDEVAEEHFGEIEEERGPGCPEVGGLVQVRLGDLLERVDAWAAGKHANRAEAVRQLVARALEEHADDVPSAAPTLPARPYKVQHHVDTLSVGGI